MSLLISQVITRARGLMHDRKDGHYVREFLNEQALGLSATFQTRNRNLLQVVDGAPADVACLVNNVTGTITTLDKPTGLLTLNATPALASQIEVRYYFEMATDAEWLDFYRIAKGAIGDETEVTLLTEAVLWDTALMPAVANYAAAAASRSLASLTHWYYSANAGNKSFNKDQVSRKFAESAEKMEAVADKLRLSAYGNRFDAATAPAYAYRPTRGIRYWEPPR